MLQFGLKTKRTFTLLVALLTMAVPVLVASPAAAASSGDFVSSINSLRASKGLGTLTVNSSLASVAQKWSAAMAAKGAISHNPSLGSQVSGNWTKLGENVGVGSNVAGLMRAFQNSPGHYRNLVDPAFNSVGVGVTIGGDGRLYTAHVFATFPGVSAPKAAAPKAAAPRTPAAPKAAAPKAAVPVQRAAAKSAPAPAAPAAAAAPAAPAAPVAPVLPAPSPRIVQGFIEVGSIAVQG